MGCWWQAGLLLAAAAVCFTVAGNICTIKCGRAALVRAGRCAGL